MVGMTKGLYLFRISVLFIFLFLSNFLSAQQVSIAYLVEKKGEASQLFVLDINDNGTLFYSNEYCENTDPEIYNFTIVEKRKNSKFFILHDQLEDLKVRINYPFILNWKLEKEEKMKDGIRLNKATVMFKGKQWIAWYDASFAPATGPFLFNQLPGLIYEIESDKFQIELVGIANNVKNCASISQNEKEIDFERYEKYNHELIDLIQDGYRRKIKGVEGNTLQDLIENSIRKDLFKELL